MLIYSSRRRLYTFKHAPFIAKSWRDGKLGLLEFWPALPSGHEVQGGFREASVTQSARFCLDRNQVCCRSHSSVLQISRSRHRNPNSTFRSGSGSFCHFVGGDVKCL